MHHATNLLFDPLHFVKVRGGVRKQPVSGDHTVRLQHLVYPFLGVNTFLPTSKGQSGPWRLNNMNDMLLTTRVFMSMYGRIMYT